MVDEFEIMLNPKKYGFEVCGHCNGYGSSLKENADRCTLAVTVGGLVKKKKKCTSTKQ